jgi:hypothetical protein
MNMKLSSIVEYVSFLIKKYGEIQQTQMKNTFRLASIKKSAGETRVIFQVIGKSTFMECSLYEILSNDAFIEGFSKKDIQKLTYAQAREEHLKEKITTNNNLKLVEQKFSIQEGKIKFALRDNEGQTTFKTATEISTDKKLISNLTQQDALNIGYIAGYENSQKNDIE